MKLQRIHFTTVQGTSIKDSGFKFARLQAEGLGAFAVGSEDSRDLQPAGDLAVSGEDARGFRNFRSCRRPGEASGLVL